MKKEEIDKFADRVLSNEDFTHSGTFFKEFKDSEKKDLIRYHSSLGRHIRNSFGLWSLKWKPKLDKDGVDVSPDHPDAISMKIIERVWEKLQNNGV